MSIKSEWQADQTTINLLKYLKEDKQNILEQWAGGSYTHETAEGTCQLNSQALGKAEALTDIINWILEDEDETEGV